jgi:hypothetical protein
MTRAVAVVVAALLTASLGIAGVMAQIKSDPAQPRMERKSDTIGQKVEGTIKSVHGNMVTLEDGTEISIPSSIQMTKDQLKPGTQISAEYEQRGSHKIAKSIQIKG